MSQEPKPGSFAAMVKSAINTSAIGSGANKKLIGLKKTQEAVPKSKASSKKKQQKKNDPEGDQDSQNGSAGSADEGQCSDHECEDSDDGHAKKASSKKAARKKGDIKPKAAAKSSPKKKNDGKKGKNKIEAGEAGDKKPAEKKKRKETALTQGWKKFSTDYICDNRGSGKKLSQLMKEASEQWCSQLFLLLNHHDNC